MKFIKKAVPIVLILALLFTVSTPPVFAFESSPLYVSLGDSITFGDMENMSDHPEYIRERDRFASIFARSIGAEHVTYSYLGMQTGNILYMFDDQFRAEVDSGAVDNPQWFENSYPPYNGVSLESVRETTAAADYISLCIGSCDYASYPESLYDKAVEVIPDVSGLREELKSLAGNGRLDPASFVILSQILGNDGERASAAVGFVLNILQGFSDYLRYYPRLVADLRELNPDAAIILIGNYLPCDYVPFISETENPTQLQFVINRLLDNMNLLCKAMAMKYGCVYVDTMGVDTVWHPTTAGHQQVCGRIMSVLNGDPRYAGAVGVSPEITERFRLDVSNAGTVVVDPYDGSDRFLQAFSSFGSRALSGLFKAVSYWFGLKDSIY